MFQVCLCSELMNSLLMMELQSVPIIYLHV